MVMRKSPRRRLLVRFYCRDADRIFGGFPSLWNGRTNSEPRPFFCRQRTLLSICPSSVLYIYTFPIIAGNDINLGSTEDTERGTRPAGSTLSESTLNLPCYISQSYRGFSAAGRNIWIALRVVGETGKRCRHGASVDSLRRHFHAAL